MRSIWGSDDFFRRMGLGLSCAVIALAFFASLSAQAQPHIVIEKAPEKRKVPDAERLAYAERLYASDRYEEVKNVTAELLKENSPLASEAQFLRGKAMFALGDVESTRLAYEWLMLRHPDSRVVRDGRLTKALSKAAGYLFEKRSWREGGKYLALLQQLDGNEVARLGMSLEKQVDRELAEFSARSEGREFLATAESLRELSRQGYNDNCSYNTCFSEDDQKCQTALDEKVAAGIRQLEESRERDWRPKLEKWFGQRRREFANQLAADVQTFPLLSQLAVEAEFVMAMRPTVLPDVPSPYVVRIENKTGSRKRYSYDFNNSRWEGKRACIEADSSRLDDIARQLALRFSRLDRDALLRRLGVLISFDRSKSKPTGPKL